MRVEPMEVIGPDGKPLEVAPGDLWVIPYRGSKYTVRRTGRAYVVSWSWYDHHVEATAHPEGLARAVTEVKGTLGSFRITAHGAVITKVLEDGGQRWVARYVGRYDGGLEFPGIENDPQDLREGMYWSGFPFSNGESWVVSPYAQGRNHLTWSMRGRRFESTERYPEVVEKYLAIRPQGGRAYITETGHLWMNVPDGALSARLKKSYRSLQEEQLVGLGSGKNPVLLRLLVERLNATKTRPIYVGRMSAFDHGESPWTRFSLQPAGRFGRGGRQAADDRLGGY